MSGVRQRAEERDHGFDCSWSAGGSDAAWVRVHGELDMSTAAEFGQTLTAAQEHARLVIVDLRELEFMDSTGLRMVLEAHDRATRAKGRLLLIRGSAMLDRLFAVSGVAERLEILDLDAAEPPAQALLRAGQRDQANGEA